MTHGRPRDGNQRYGTNASDGRTRVRSVGAQIRSKRGDARFEAVVNELQILLRDQEPVEHGIGTPLAKERLSGKLVPGRGDTMVPELDEPADDRMQ